ncbi:hypothetical protein P3S68_023288 [Capsicum galapagoense]
MFFRLLVGETPTIFKKRIIVPLSQASSILNFLYNYHYCSNLKNQNNFLLASWKPSSDACNDRYGVACINGRVNTLNITNASVVSTLYDFPFSSLPFLENVDLSMNNLSGTIPPEIGNLTNLIYLDLHTNQISGIIPSQISSLAKLQIPRIFDNHLNGPIPGEIGQLRSLTELSLGMNFLNGSIPASLGNLNNLSHLYLYENHPSGSIPKKRGKLVNLVEAYLETSQLTGHIPPEMGNLTNAKVFYAFSNELFGPIPAELGKMRSLQNLSLYSNNLSGPIPKTIGDLTELKLLNLNFQYLFLGDNNMTEEIPSSFCNLTSLKFLHLSRNNLKGKILQCLGNISGLHYVTKSHNNLCGELPSAICNLTSLEILDLARNNLKGAIPQCFGNMSRHLEVLDIQHNDLTGTLPTTFSIGSALQSFNLHGNKDNLLNDTFPMWLGTLPELRVLSLKSNKLHGPIRTLGNENIYPELRFLDLSFNAFMGNLLMSLFQHFNAMKKIDPSKKAPSDERYGYYENSIAVVTKGLELEVVRILFLYTTIDLSNNKFEGHIPSIIGDLIALRILNLSHNGLQGPIPPSLGSLSSVESLDLSGNHLGCIPQGPQFHTFENNSFEGNDGLRGFPLSKGCGNCGNDSASEETYTGSALDEESNSEFLNDFWKAALMGYGTGLCIGLSIIYIMISTGNMKWLARIIEELKHKIILGRRKKQQRQRNYRRRNNRV